MIFRQIMNLVSGKKKLTDIWDVSLLIRKTFNSGEVLTIPEDKALILISPHFKDEVILKGELRVL